jgi:hypothetical protein
MNETRYSKVLNFAWYQLLWFVAVMGGDTLAWLLLVLLVMHLLSVASLRSELTLMVPAALMGCAIDSVIAAAGYYVFDPAPRLLPIPVWLIAIWLGFAGTLRHSMGWLVARPGLMTILTSVGAPLTYLAAARLGAVSFPMGLWPTALVVGLCWAAMSPALCWLAERSRRPGSRPSQMYQPMLTREVKNG